jgi:dipeptidyl aminopeptidase/acylaminoacyl peptidase
MALTAGTKLGPYEIQSPLGVGGMGEVYRAKDCKLKREVALKVLPELFASDGQRMARFEREAQVLASMNHPNIAHIYGVEEWSAAGKGSADSAKAGAGALVMEFSSPRISPDGKKIIFTRGGHGFNIWSYDVAHGIKTPLTFGTASNQSNLFPVWSPDNTHIAYTSVREGKFGFYERAADGSGSEKTLMDGTDYVRYLNDWSPDGKFLAFQDNHTGVSSIFVLPLGDEHTPRPVLQSPAVRSSFSADGKWMAYCSIESGNINVYVVPFPGPGGKWQISSGGGDYPRWRRDGNEIFYLSLDGKMMSAEVKASGSSFAVGPIKQLFETRAYRSEVGAYDVTADGQRFILSYEPGQPNAVLTLVENWDAELKKK